MSAKSVRTVAHCARRLGSLYSHQWNIKTSLSGLQYRRDNQRIWIMLSSVSSVMLFLALCAK